MSADDAMHMQTALHCARNASDNNEVPVGALIVLNGSVISEGTNAPIGLCDPTAHAEIVAIRKAAQVLGNYRLTGSTLYVTIEPCSMCLGAIVHARISRVVFGAREPKAGALVSNTHQIDSGIFNHQFEIAEGVLKEECAGLMSEFFQRRRALKAQLKHQTRSEQPQSG
jgi:tRNA(adenine34) deaminase